jgi:hypothetical protein
MAKKELLTSLFLAVAGSRQSVCGLPRSIPAAGLKENLAPFFLFEWESLSCCLHKKQSAPSFYPAPKVQTYLGKSHGPATARAEFLRIPTLKASLSFYGFKGGMFGGFCCE